MAETRRPRLRRPVVLLLWAGGIVLVLSALFLLTDALPGDVAAALAGADHARADEIRHQRGLDRPVAVRLLHWWGGALHGDLGTSLVDQSPVAPLVAGHLRTTLAAAVPAVVLSTLGAVAGALGLAWWRGRTAGRVLAVAVGILAGLPEVVLVVVLVHLLSARWHLVPAVSLLPSDGSAWSQPVILVLPVLALSLPAAAWGARSLRGSADDLVALHVVASARRRGVPAHRVLLRHLLPRWRGPVAQAVAVQAAGILGGSVVVESMLAFPGLGNAMAGAVASRDTPVVQGCGCVLVTISVTLLAVAGLLARPRELPSTVVVDGAS